jgi:hypothetical protein
MNVCYKDTLIVESFYDMPTHSLQGGRTVTNMCDQCANYFVGTEGEVCWQLNKI